MNNLDTTTDTAPAGVNSADHNSDVIASMIEFLNQQDGWEEFNFDFIVQDLDSVFEWALSLTMQDPDKDMGISFGLLGKLAETFGCNVMSIEFQPLAEVTQVPWNADIIGWKFRIPSFDRTLPIFNQPLPEPTEDDDLALESEEDLEDDDDENE